MKRQNVEQIITDAIEDYCRNIKFWQFEDMYSDYSLKYAMAEYITKKLKEQKIV